MVIIAALPKRATIHGDTIQVLPDITRDFSSDNYLNILRESGAYIIYGLITGWRSIDNL